MVIVLMAFNTKMTEHGERVRENNPNQPFFPQLLVLFSSAKLGVQMMNG